MTDAHDKLRDPKLSRLYEQASHAEPPPALDDAILAAARAAAAPQLPPRPWWRRLQAPLALAATAILAIALTLSIDRNPPLDGEIPANPSSKERPPATEQVAPASRNAAEALAPAAPAAGIPERKEAQHSKATPEKQTPATSLQDSPRPAAPTAVQGAPGASTAKAAPAPAADAESADMRGSERRKPLAEPALEAKREAATPLPQKSPEAWLEEIRSLRRQGRLAEAEHSLREFRTTYPAYQLPEDLR